MIEGAGASPWEWHPHPEVWVLVAALAAGYAWALKRLGPGSHEPGDPPATRLQRFAFFSGVAAIWVAADWPLHELAEEHLYSMHMVQHILLTLVAPALILAGTPDWLARRILDRTRLTPLLRRVTRPLPALLLFNGVLVASHWPLVVDASLRSEPLHLVLHGVLVGAALVMWWPVLSPVPEIPRLSYPGQMLYLFGQTIVPTVPASFLTFASFPIYEFYAEVPRHFGISVIDDQQMGGLIMKLGGGMLLAGVIAVIYFRWAFKEESPEKPDTLEWHEIERDVNRLKGAPS